MFSNKFSVVDVIVCCVFTAFITIAVGKANTPSQEAILNHWEELQKKKTMPNEVFEKPNTWLSHSDQSAIASFVDKQRKVGRDETLETISCSNGEVVFSPPL